MILAGIVLLFVAAAVYVTGLTIADIEDIRRARDIQHHPFAARRRVRPTIAVHVRGNSEQTTLKHVGYRKLVFTDNVACDYTLELDSRAQLPHGALHDAVFILQCNPHLAAVAIPYATSSPTSLVDLLVHYREYIGALSDKSRRGLRLDPRHHAYARLVRTQPASSRFHFAWETLHSAFAYLATLFMSYIFLYSLFVAISTHQTILFAVLLASLSTFLVYVIFSAQRLSWADKCLHILLLPASVPFLVLQPWWRCINQVRRLIGAWYQRSRLALRTISGA